MKNQRLNLLEFGHALGRSEMKKLMAGSGTGSCNPGGGGGGNIYYELYGVQLECHSSSLLACTEECKNLAPGNCGGCAKVPEYFE